MNKHEDVQTQAFAPIYNIREKTIDINLESGILSCSVKAYNQFLKIITKSLEFHRKEKLEIEWSEDHEDYYVTFEWTGGIEVTSIPKGSTIPDIINKVINAWVKEDTLDNSETQPWKHAEDLRYMKILWINKLFQRLIKAWDPKFVGNEHGILKRVGKQLSEYMPIIQRIGSIDAVIGEGRICEDPKLLLGLILSNPEEFFVFKDCEPHSDLMPDIYFNDPVKHYSDSYFGVDIVWQSKTERLDSWVAEGSGNRFIGHDKEDSFDWRLPFDCHNINKDPDYYGEIDVRSWIVDERTFSKKRRLVAKKFVFERTGEEKLVTTSIKKIGWKAVITDKDKIELLKTIFGSVNISEEKYRPLSSREIPFSDKGIEFIAKKIIGAKETDFSKENLVKARVDKHRLGSKLIEIGQLLEWWSDLGDVFFESFSVFDREKSEKIAELPLRVLGSGIRKAFDIEYDHEERDVVTKET